MSSDGPRALEFLRSTLNWVEQLEKTPDPSLGAKAVAELKEILVARIAKLEIPEGGHCWQLDTGRH
jgi:hypothetical protein